MHPFQEPEIISEDFSPQQLPFSSRLGKSWTGDDLSTGDCVNTI